MQDKEGQKAQQSLQSMSTSSKSRKHGRRTAKMHVFHGGYRILILGNFKRTHLGTLLSYLIQVVPAWGFGPNKL